MVEDLGMNGIQYNIALSLFFIPYILLEGTTLQSSRSNPNAS
jgi:hypothetical protein